MSQGDSVYDFVDKRDHAVWKSKLMDASRSSTKAAYNYDINGSYCTTTSVADSSDRPFYCRMYRARNCRRLPPASAEHKVGSFEDTGVLCIYVNL